MFDYSLKNIGRRIKEEREKNDLTQQQFAQITGISIAHLGKIERGTTGDIGFSKICNIVQSLNISLNDIVSSDKKAFVKEVSMQEDTRDIPRNKTLLFNLINDMNETDFEFLIYVLHAYKKALKEKQAK